ncbi:type II toxin-antitoxin system RelE/ParE family toxin [uncultured Chryseobacterium sp.]|uniref:type II toxin-antitoxin system RelE/ParE family toxin n=1 Tax=uncultured Chryseobacterium sp. TaxID=259322 RepID=UPI0025D3EDD8|nr:type II toxin-antitoxin system RelE/ParE family toxin [uncultured Chryseobacterium sp.]
MKITISETAKRSLDEIIDFLKIRWTVKEINVLKNDIEKFRKTITDDIVKHPSLENFPDLKYTLIGKKQIKLFYEVRKNEIVIKLFWHCKQNPIRLKNILNENK